MLKNKTSLILSMLFLLTIYILSACNDDSNSVESVNQNDSDNDVTNNSDSRISIKLSFPNGPGSMLYEAAAIYKEKVEERSGGEIEINLFPDGQLGKDLAVLDSMKSGSIEMSIAASVLPSVIEEFGIFETPFLFENREEVAKVANSDVWEKDLKELFPEHGLVGLGFWETGFRQMTNNVRPIFEPEDLKGLKMRVPDSPPRIELFKELGANPTPMDYTEIFTGLQQGVIDGQENPLSSIKGASYEEVQKYLSITNHIYTPAFLVASEKWFNELSEEDKELLSDTAVEVQEDVWKLGQEADDELLEYFQEQGIEINEANIKAFKEKVENLESDVDPDLVEKILKVIE